MMNNKIKVFARIKPPRDLSRSHLYELRANTSESGGKTILLLYGGSDKFCLNSQQKLHEVEEFMFENVFTETCTQEYIYNSMAKPVVERAIEGFNGTIMAYGQTGTGKTHTMCGGRDRGIIPRAFKQVFQAIKELRQTHTCKVFLSVMEIYNEHAYDLLSDRFTNIGLARDKTKQVTPRNLKTVQVSNMHQLDKLLKKAWNNRIVSETPMNDASSRSHCIFSLHLEQSRNDTSALMLSKVHMIDLSGSEKLGKKRPSGVLLNETRHINLSLHYIELVIRALSDKNRDHIPYRNSMITSFLRDSLGGNSNTVMVFTISLEPMYFEETVLTCRFAQRVSLISNKMKKQITQNPDMEFVNINGAYQKNNELLPEEFDHEMPGISQVASQHKGINCKLDFDSELAADSDVEETDEISDLSDDISHKIKEMFSKKNLKDFQFCCDKYEREEENCISELNNILNDFMDISKSYNLLAKPRILSNSSSIYDHMGMSLPPKSPVTGKAYRTKENEEFSKYLSETLNAENFKTEYYDECCDLTVKEYKASTALNEVIMHFEKAKNKIRRLKSKSNDEKKEKLRKKIKLIRENLHQNQLILQEIRNERELMFKKLEDLRMKLITKFHEEWLPEKESALTKDVNIEKISQNQLLKKSVSTKNLKKKISNQIKYHKKTKTSSKRSLKGIYNTISDTMIAHLSRESKADPCSA